MAGIYGLLSGKHQLDKKIYRHFYSSGLSGIINEEFKNNRFTFGRSVLPAFGKDRFIYQDENLIFAFEGICYTYKKDEIQEKLLAAYRSSGISFVENIEGHFCGFVYDQQANKLHVFTDQLSTKPLYLYYNQEKEIIFFASELKAITRSLHQAGISMTPDEDALRCLLTFGYMLDDLTPVKEIKKIPSGTILAFDENDFSVKSSSYFKLEKKPVSDSYEDILHDINELLTEAVRAEWEKDLEYKLEHFTFLSGGLDSRVNAMIGSTYTSSPVHSLTFSEPDTPDQKIAVQIAADKGFDHSFMGFQNGNYLVQKELEYIKANDGLVAYYGAAHQQYSLQKYDLHGKGLAHSGQIGDVIFGSFTKEGSSVEDGLKKLAFNNDREIIAKIDTWNKLKSSNFNGVDLELFSLHHRQINGTLNGDRCSAHFADLSSPFYRKSLISYCLNIPDKYKIGQKIYLDWMNRFHPEISSYKWASTGALPSNKFRFRAQAFNYRLKNYLLRKAGIDKVNMNPFNYWYKTNAAIRNSLQLVYSERDLAGLDSDLITDIEACFNSGNVTAKMQAITAILSYKLHFTKD